MSEKTRMDCRIPGFNNYCMVDTIPPTHWSWRCPECEAHEFERDLERMAKAEDARRAMLGEERR
jgi:hypothetical protein